MTAPERVRYLLECLQEMEQNAERYGLTDWNWRMVVQVAGLYRRWSGEEKALRDRWAAVVQELESHGGETTPSAGNVYAVLYWAAQAGLTNNLLLRNVALEHAARAFEVLVPTGQGKRRGFPWWR